MTPQEKLDLALTNFDPLLDGLARLIEAVAHPEVNAIPPGDGSRHSGQTLMLKLYLSRTPQSAALELVGGGWQN